MLRRKKTRTTILGVEFFSGTVEQAVATIEQGGLLVVPAAPALKNLTHDRVYREALLGADLAITDSAFMVMIWNFLQGDNLQRLSGLQYQRYLLDQQSVRDPGNTVWVMANKPSAKRNLEYLATVGISVPEECVYTAPMYGEHDAIEDQELVDLIDRLRPHHVVITIGGGSQEKLGFYLKQHLSFLPAIHCTGAAIAFLSGDQVHIPGWADRLYMGWLVRSLSDPMRFIPRYWDARKLFQLIVRYRERLPATAD
ncbi:UDP-N-acetyl-D-mannosaminuronic acid transferase, WecB/TagA/CpsF family [Bryocella elongata]|uniref:UDP-N-acetyl-D-mannosaminuronic acid transferase, WecB/TagA/CpsF family n=1 Tax=Bryocella elongata TaxID=863522 RepID=A0A1H5ZR32_9BACT|nr:WecB/TagA/CpsF family glycosyltransferase [Bryocella elongata]SEG38454.1 UDP-N-acetyl-D-mannosaminuronic acid transferase, WecB/TagA/CpsF family [Bryocella elongata]